MHKLTCCFLFMLPLVTNGCSNHEQFRGATAGQLSRSSLLPFDRPVEALRPNGFRLKADPAFARMQYLVELQYADDPDKPDLTRPNAATGVFQIAVGPEDGTPKILSYALRVPRQDYRSFVARVDWLLAHGGRYGNCSDGTGVSIERITSGKTLYYSGNLCEPSDPSMAISALLLPLLHQYGPQGLSPSRSDWYFEEGHVPRQLADLGAFGMAAPEDGPVKN